ncbi:glycosyltransferase [Parvicella tangerina]|uniref:D-inositol-3-phosphate glycosyltransferase n=1 Tax=Parvicella tangerina TaxID=2829795 RepID=A0A916NS04_9FLAO|nr:glycosyltransferase [Parvicella tangerina]CAG5082619.1 D-inositol-3-phosphate glycosyltransferase [Parvicella tangerina]
MKKILHITTWYPNEYDNQLGVFIKKHIQLGHSFANNVVIAIIPDSRVKKPKATVNKDKNFVEIIGYYRARAGSKWSNYRNYQRVQTLVLQELLKMDFMPDFIHCHVGEKSIALANKFFPQTPRFVTEHWSGFLNGTFDSYKEKRRKKRIAEINTCNQLFVVSESLKRALKNYGVTIPIAIIPNVIEQGKVKSNYSTPPKFVVVADLIDDVKNISGIIKAYQDAAFEEGITLTIVGDGPDRDKLEKLAQDSSITFLGKQDNEWVLTNLSEFDILIVNSKIETYSMITAEALLCGLPVVAAKCGGPEQFVEHGKNGWLVEVDNSNELMLTLQKAVKLLPSISPDEVSKSIKDLISIEKVRQTFEHLYS